MLKIITVVVTEFQQNTRILCDLDSSQAIVIDPGGDVDKILQALRSENCKCKEVWLTHSHLDHCGGVAELLEHQAAKLSGHPDESFMRANVIEICKMYGMPLGEMRNCPEPDQHLSGGEELEFAGYKFKVLFTPGHSPGHLSFYCKEIDSVFSGDVIFSGSIGRTDLPGGNHRTLLESIEQEIFTLPADTKIYPGHGPETTVKIEKETNPFFQ